MSRCTLPAAAAKGATLGLGVSVADKAVRASLLRADGTVVAVGERAVVSGPALADLADAVRAAIAEAVERSRAASPPPVGQTAPTTVASSTTLPAFANHPGTEKVIEEFSCNILRGVEGVGSRCSLTSLRVRIEPHAINVQSQPEDIALADIASVDAVPTLGFIPNGLLITLKNGTTRQLVVSNRDHLVSAVRGALPQ